MNRGEIWLVDLDPTIGAEMNKTRPALIMSDNRLGKLPLKVIVPITGWKEHYSIAPWMIKIEPNADNGLTKISSIDCFQIRSVSQNRLMEKIGKITSDEINKVQEGILDLFGNPIGSLTSPAFFRAKALQKCCFYKEVVQKLKFPNNSIKNFRNIIHLSPLFKMVTITFCATLSLAEKK